MQKKRSKTERKYKMKKEITEDLFLEYFKKNILSKDFTLKKENNFLHQNQGINKKEDDVEKHEEIKEMEKERETLKKLIRKINSVSGEIFLKNQYFDKFDEEIKEMQILNLKNKTISKPLTYKEKHIEQSNRLIKEIKNVVSDPNKKLSKDIFRKIKEFTDQIDLAYKSPKFIINHNLEKPKLFIHENLNKDTEKTEEYFRLKDFLKKICENFTSKQIQVSSTLFYMNLTQKVL